MAIALLLITHCSQTTGCRAQGSWCSALPRYLCFLLFGPPWGHGLSDFLSLVPQFTRRGWAQICAVTQDTGWKVRDNAAREPFGKRCLRGTETPAIPSGQEELGIPHLLKDFSNNWLKSLAVSSLLSQSYFSLLPGGEKIQFAAYCYHCLSLGETDCPVSWPNLWLNYCCSSDEAKPR